NAVKKRNHCPSPSCKATRTRCRRALCNAPIVPLHPEISANASVKRIRSKFWQPHVLKKKNTRAFGTTKVITLASPVRRNKAPKKDFSSLFSCATEKKRRAVLAIGENAICCNKIVAVIARDKRP